MSDINTKRAFVYNMYSASGWHKKVDKMSDAQVIAIFLRNQNKAKENTETEENPDDGDAPF